MAPGSKLQSEIKQRKPFRSTAQEAAISLMRTADVVRTFFAGVLAPFGITLQQFNVLRILRGAGPAGLPTLEIGDRMIQRTPGVTRLVDRLERKGLVERTRDASDRRVVSCRLTPDGLELLAQLDGEIERADQRAVGALSSRDQERLIEYLDRIRGAHV